MENYFILLFVLVFGSCSLQKKYQEHDRHFEKDIQKLEHKTDHIGQEDYLLFVGSSSIVRWKTVAQDISPYAAVMRGYGGAHYYDLIHFIDRLVVGHQKASAVLIFVANDITGKKTKTHLDLTPTQVKRLFVNITKRVARKLGKDLPIFTIETTPTPSRLEAWPKIAEANDMIRVYTEKKNNLHYISTRAFYFDKKGIPNNGFFVNDQLHLNRKGYQLWGEIIKNNINNNLFPLSKKQ